MAASATGSSTKLSLALDAAEVSKIKARELVEARGEDVTVHFTLPDGRRVSGVFGAGQEVGALKLWLVENHCFREADISVHAKWEQDLLRDGSTALLNMFSLCDLPGVKPGDSLEVTVKGEVEVERTPRSAAAAGGLGAELASGAAGADADGDDDDGDDAAFGEAA